MKYHLKTRFKVILVIIIIISTFFIYSRYIGNKGIIVNEYNIINKNIPESFYGYKIVHISDIHYRVTTDSDDLNKIVKEINKTKPDIVIFSGDLFDHNIKYTEKDYEDITNFLKNINCNIGKYIIKGEEDLKNQRWDEIISASGFIDLDDTYTLLYNNSNEPILLMGISSNYKKNHIKETIDSFKIDTKYKYAILVLHEPDYINEIDYSKFNLILAGHNHGGQIRLPLIGGIIYDKVKIYKDSYYKFKNTKVYITSGIGCSKYKFRFLNKPSFNLYRLRNK